jgi:hypothetical protein
LIWPWEWLWSGQWQQQQFHFHVDCNLQREERHGVLRGWWKSGYGHSWSSFMPPDRLVRQILSILLSFFPN